MEEWDKQVVRDVRVYCGLKAALEKLTNEATVLSEHAQRAAEYSDTLGELTASFDQVQSRLIRVAAVKPALSKILV